MNETKESLVKLPGFRKKARAKERGSARVTVLALSFFILGIVVSAFWFSRGARRDANNNASVVALSESTVSVLNGLESPVEIRFYSLLSPDSASDVLRAFSGRVDQLLAEYEQAGGDKLKVNRELAQSGAAADAASADGIKPFNVDKGDACFLGLAVVGGKQRESLAQLSPDWEPALESDLTHAIVRVANAKPAASVPATAVKVDLAVTKEVQQAIPNLASVTAEEGARILRETALKEFQAAAGEMEVQVKDAQQRLTQARNSGAEAEQQAAMKHLQEVQAANTEKLKQIAARSQAQIEALEQIKRK